MKIRLSAPLQPDSIVDGEGIRTVIWTQGCNHNCKGCHNPETHDFSKGIELDVEDVENTIANFPRQDGVTLSGGDPFFQLKPSSHIAKFCKNNKLNVWAYTGFTFEKLYEDAKYNEELRELMNNIDVLVDGRFVLEQRSLNLYFKGSKNQRLLDMKQSMMEGRPVEIEKYKGEKCDFGYDSSKKEEECMFI